MKKQSKTPTTSKVDLFEVLNAIKRHNFEFFDQLEEKQYNSIAPYLLQRWIAGYKNPTQHLLLSECSNKYVFPLFKEKKLLIFLLGIAAVNTSDRYKWIPFKKVNGRQQALDIVSQHYNCNEEQSERYLNLLSVDQLVTICEYEGLEDKQIKEMIQQYETASL